MPTDINIDTAVIGAGVVGLAVARQLQLAGREVFVFDRYPRIGMGESSRNSEVIHAGIYYSNGSLKAKLCVRGKALLYAYCAARSIPYRRTGKLIVAVTPDEVPRLEGYLATGQRNGVLDLALLDAATLHAMEPAVLGMAALWSPSSGIINSHQFMECLQADLEAAGGYVVLGSGVKAWAVEGAHIKLQLDDQQRTTVEARTVINAAGLHATSLAHGLAGIPPGEIPRQYFARGHYFALSGPSPFHHLVYPIPEAGGLGIHATLDLDGAVRFGPDVQWINSVDHRFDQGRKDAFVQAIGRYLPGLNPERLQPAYTGIRTKISGPGEPAADFQIHGPEKTGHPGLVHLFGIESPGLTASLAIAEHVADLLDPQ